MRRRASALLAAVGLAVTGCAGTPAQPAASVVTDADGYVGTVVDPPVGLPDVTLTGTDGSPFALREQTRAPITLFVFAYTSCADECPLTVSSITAALRRLPDADREDVELVVLSADPVRDSPAVLRRWLDRFDPSLRGATGDVADLQTVADALYIPVELPSSAPTADPADAAGGGDVLHGLQIWAFGADDTSRLVWGNNPTPTELRQDLVRLLADARQS